MTTPSGPSESYPNPDVERILAAALDQIRGSLDPGLAGVVLPPDSTLFGIQTEVYESQTLQAGRDAMPGRYESVDRNLIMLNLQAGRQVFLVGGRIDPEDAFDLASTLGGGVDLRAINRLIYTYDGAGTITEYMQDGGVNVYGGETGDPDFLVAHIRQALGTCVAIEALGQPVPPGQMMES